jgi:HD-like signal output (HDOD) protein
MVGRCDPVKCPGTGAAGHLPERGVPPANAGGHHPRVSSDPTRTLDDPTRTLDRAREILRRAHAVPPSRGLLRLEDTLRRGDASTRQLTGLVEGSPALAARVLRMANSSFYSPAEPVVSLSRAVPMLGHTVLRQLVLATLVLSRQATGRSASQGLAAARMTGNAVRAAVVARALSARTRIAAPDDAFSAGLLHDLGHVYLLDDTGDAYATYLLGETPADPLAREIELAGTTHQDVGFAFAGDWNLPPALVAVLRRHHDPEPRSLGAILAAADALVAEVHHPSPDAPEAAGAASDAALDAIACTRGEWDEMAPRVRADYAELLTVFERFGG